MLITKINEIEGAYSTGFDAEITDMTVIIRDGGIHFESINEDEEMVKENYVFSGFMFDVVADDELHVIYDVYLCGDNTVHVERTEIGGTQLAMYSGDKELLHCLCTFMIPPKCTSLADVDVNVTLLKNKDDVR